MLDLDKLNKVADAVDKLSARFDVVQASSSPSFRPLACASSRSFWFALSWCRYLFS